MSIKSRLREKVVEAFGEPPAEVAALGDLLSVHPPSALAKTAARLAATTLSWRVVGGIAIALPVIGLPTILLWPLGVPFGKAPPEGWASVPVIGLVLGLCTFYFWWRMVQTGQPARPQKGQSLPGLIVYPNALVHVRDGEFTVIRWADVQTLEAPPSAAHCWRVTARDGRTIDLPAWLDDDGIAIETTIERVKEVLLPQFVRKIEDGKKVMFGPFGVSRRGVYYKAKKASWDDVTSMKLFTGAAVGLQIRTGGLLPWCTYNLLQAPNGEVAISLLPRVAPERLLRPE